MPRILFTDIQEIHRKILFMILAANHSILIEKMMREMEELTAVDGKQCISFRPKNESDIYFITIFNGTGCYAPVSQNVANFTKDFLETLLIGWFMG